MAERSNGRQLSGLVGFRRRPDQAGDAQPRVRHRPPRKMGRDAPDPQGHRRQPDAVGRRPAARGGPGPEREAVAIVQSNNKSMMAGNVRAGGKGRSVGSRSRTTSRSPRRAFRRSPIGNRRSSRPMKRPSQQPASKSGSKTPRLTLPGDDPGRQGRAHAEGRGSARRGKGRRGRQAAARPAGGIREDRRRAQPRARQPRREHAAQAAQGRLAASVQDRRPDQRPGVSAVFGVAGYRVGIGAGEGSWRAVGARKARPATTSRSSWTTCTRTSSAGGSCGSRPCSTRCGSSTSSAACGSSATT